MNADRVIGFFTLDTTVVFFFLISKGFITCSTMSLNKNILKKRRNSCFVIHFWKMKEILFLTLFQSLHQILQQTVHHSSLKGHVNVPSP